ncbi:MAG: tyrosine-type recombinase/integrase [Agathobacter sp.]
MAEIRTDSKGNRLFKGERERKDGRYEYRYTNFKGEKRSIYENRLQRLRIEEAKIAFKERINIINGLKEMTLNDMYEIWIATKCELKENTLIGYRATYDSFVRNGFGKCNLEEIRAIDVKSFYRAIKLERNLSVETICRIQNILYQIFQQAVDSEMIMKNPADKATKEFRRNHSKRTSAVRGIREKQAVQLTDFIYATPELSRWYPIFYIMIYTGMRLGEVLALRWSDVNFEKGYVDINHNMSYYKKAGEKHARYHASSGTKTIAGNRKIPFGKKVAVAFEMEKEYQRRMDIVCVDEFDGYTDFVFLNRFGRVYDPCVLNRTLSRIVEKYNQEYENMEDVDAMPHLSCHSLRHTYAVILCERNVNVKVMQLLLGHKDISTTMDTYTQVQQEFAFEEYARKCRE